MVIPPRSSQHLQRPPWGVAAALALLGTIGAIAGCTEESAAAPSTQSDDLTRARASAGPDEEGSDPTTSSRGLAQPELPLLPDPGSSLAPALTRVAEGVDAGELADVDACAPCHADAVAQWRTSAHAWASFNNPIYRASIDRFQGELGPERSRFCAGCHDPALLVDLAIDEPINADDPRAHAGVTCMTCHGIDEVSADGNGSYHLARSVPPIPELDDPTSVAAHRRAVRSPVLRSGDLCGACHRSFLGEATGHPAHLAGADDLGPWQASAYAGHPGRLDQTIAEQDCVACHMVAEAAPGGDRAAKGGTIASHRFLGGHTWLAAIRGDDATATAIEEFLRGSVSVDIAALRHGDRYTLPADAAPVIVGERIEAEVVLRNLRVGHHFPGGTRDSHDTRLHVELYGADGMLLARSERPHQLRAGVVGEDGAPRLAREVEALRVGAYDHTIAPRDAVVIRFAVELPDELPDEAWPLSLRASVLHRSRSPELVRATCEAANTATGRSFVGASQRLRGEPLDACAQPPESVLAETSVELGAGARERSARPTWERLYELGLGLEHEVQERLDRSRSAYEAALSRCDDRPEPRRQIIAGLAEVAARQGRVDDALALADQALALGGEAPAIDRLRGQALAAVWRWEEAIAPLARVALAFPGDPLAWRQLAIAQGSVGSPEEALRAARQGLALAPRDPDLLRAQALALRAQEHEEAERALDSYLAHRPADFGPQLRSACRNDSPSCALERVPVHTHELTWVDDR